jgi:hypothetical protein
MYFMLELLTCELEIAVHGYRALVVLLGYV